MYTIHKLINPSKYYSYESFIYIYNVYVVIMRIGSEQEYNRKQTV